MEATDKSKANDYAVAKELNGKVSMIMSFMYVVGAHDLSSDQQLEEINRLYILITHELEAIYARNPELQAITPAPIWKRFDVLKRSNWDIMDYIDDNDDTGQNHLVRVEKLCIIAGVDKPRYTPKQQILVESIEAQLHAFGKKLVAANNEINTNKIKNRQIPSYDLEYRLDGSILINSVLRLKKAHAGSSTERLLEQALKSPNELFKPDIGQTSRNLSTVLSSAGFTKELRQLFFPTVSNSKGVIFRPTISRKQADDDGIDTTDLDTKLMGLGAETEPKNV